MATTQQSTLTTRQKAANAAARKAAKAEGQTPKLCDCACGGFTVNPKARFISGHDAILKSNLLKAFDGGDEESGLRLITLGWYSNDTLSERAARREAKAKAKADRVAAKAAKKATA